MKTLIAAAAALPLLVPSLAEAANYEIDASHSSAQFSVRHLMVANVRGEFTKVSGSLQYDEKAPAKSTLEATIEAESISTRDEKRDAHLKSADFLDVANHPTLTFKSKKVSQVGKGRLKVAGDLTIRGRTREVVLDVFGPTKEVKDPWGNTKMAAAATTFINRKDFGLVWNAPLEAGGVLVGEEVEIRLDVELLKKDPEKQASR